MHTSMRRSEILALRWSDIDLRRRTITLTHTKNNERRVIPVNDTVAAVLKAWPLGGGHRWRLSWPEWPHGHPCLLAGVSSGATIHEVATASLIRWSAMVRSR